MSIANKVKRCVKLISSDSGKGRKARERGLTMIVLIHGVLIFGNPHVCVYCVYVYRDL